MIYVDRVEEASDEECRGSDSAWIWEKINDNGFYIQSELFPQIDENVFPVPSFYRFY